MLTYNKDTDALELYDGSAFGPVGSDAGLIHIEKTTFGTGVAAVSVNDVFSADYNIYKVFINCRTVNDTWVRMRYRVAGSDDSSNNYRSYAGQLGASLSGFTENPATSQRIGYISNPDIGNSIEMTIINPFATARTNHIGINSAGNTPNFSVTGSRFGLTTSFTGFTFFADGGNMDGGFVSVFGLKES
jgi:hypothetical protein